MKKSIFILFILTAFVSSIFGKEKINIRVGDFAPFYFQDEEGKWQGLDVELAEAVVKNAGFDVEYKEMPWSRALVFLEKGKVDLVMNVSITTERSRKFNFIGPERYAQMGLVVRVENKNFDIKTYDDFAEIVKEENKKFGIQIKVFYGKEFNDKLKDPEYSKYFAEAFSVNNNIFLLANDRILGFFEDKISLAYMIKNHPDFQETVLHSFDAFPKEPVYFAVSKKMSEDIYKKLKKSYEELEENGILEGIREKYR